MVERTPTETKGVRKMITCLIVMLNEWKYIITRKRFIECEDLGLPAIAELMFEFCLLIICAIMNR